MADRSRLKARACRNLTLEFGEDNDHKEDATERLEDEQRRSADLENEFNEMLATSLNSKIQRWNFDFVTETPLEGDWDWYFEKENPRRQAESQPRDDTEEDKNVNSEISDLSYHLTLNNPEDAVGISALEPVEFRN